MLVKLLFILLPTAVAVTFVAFKVPPKAKAWFFSIPVWLSASMISWLIMGHVVTGVLAGPAICICDLMLTPAFSLIKRVHEKKHGKVIPLTERLGMKKATIKKETPASNVMPTFKPKLQARRIA